MSENNKSDIIIPPLEKDKENTNKIDYLSCNLISMQLITKFFIIINATKLGWIVSVENNKIILTKQSNLLTSLDKNTCKLINTLIQNSYNETLEPIESINSLESINSSDS
jgi:hypothetical protein